MSKNDSGKHVMPDSTLASPCSLYCGVCGIYQATQSNDDDLLKLFLRVYRPLLYQHHNLTIQDLKCDGCLSDRKSVLCQSCSIRQCSLARNITGCHECPAFPCSLIADFPIPVGKKIILRSVPYRKQSGTKKWVSHELSRYICPRCSNKLYRGGTRCRRCREKASGD